MSEAVGEKGDARATKKSEKRLEGRTRAGRLISGVFEAWARERERELY